MSFIPTVFIDIEWASFHATSYIDLHSEKRELRLNNMEFHLKYYDFSSFAD